MPPALPALALPTARVPALGVKAELLSCCHTLPAWPGHADAAPEPSLAEAER